jgi:hypothetical protein
MKRNQCLLAAAGAVLLAGTAHASFQYSSRDLMFVLRNDSSSGSDMEVNIGSVNAYASQLPGTTVPITTFSTVQYSLANSAANINNLYFSVIGGDAIGDGDATFTDRTLWLTRPRADVLTQTDPWQRRSSSTQGNILSAVLGVGNNLKGWSAGTAADPISNSDGVVLIPNGDPNSYTILAGTEGSLNGSFGQGTIENGFLPNSSGVLSSDLYQISPGSGDSVYLGTFNLDTTSGSLSFTAVPEPSTWGILAISALMMSIFQFSRTKKA